MSNKTAGQEIFEAARSTVRKGAGLAALVKAALATKDYGAFIEAATINDAVKNKEERRAVKVRMTQELRRQSKDEKTGDYLAVEKNKTSKLFEVIAKTGPSPDDNKRAEQYAKWLRERGYTVTK